jgi:hypothetical protein
LYIVPIDGTLNPVTTHPRQTRQLISHTDSVRLEDYLLLPVAISASDAEYYNNYQNHACSDTLAREISPQISTESASEDSEEDTDENYEDDDDDVSNAS